MWKTFGPSLDPVTDGLDFGRLLEHLDAPAPVAERERRGEAAQASADDEDRMVLRVHGLRACGCSNFEQ
jgi:hypothetical protein